MASDSRVSWVDAKTHLITRWFDSKDYLKTISLDGVLYGFAGVNSFFKTFLENYNTKGDSVDLLDSLVVIAKNMGAEFYILRYDTNLQLFAHSPEVIGEHGNEEIFRISKDPIINKDLYAIGSGAHSQKYKAHRLNSSAAFPIRKIVDANTKGLKKANVLHLLSKVAKDKLTPEESRRVFQACSSKGGDLGTGGEVNMTTNAINKKQLAQQVAIMNKMDGQAKANGAVCASPINAASEIKKLNDMGHYAVSPHSVEMTPERKTLIDKMSASLNASIG
jgi:ATP-dependent protease HslVU (ClpYQ) peptidase subunit